LNLFCIHRILILSRQPKIQDLHPSVPQESRTPGLRPRRENRRAHRRSRASCGVNIFVKPKTDAIPCIARVSRMTVLLPAGQFTGLSYLLWGKRRMPRHELVWLPVRIPKAGIGPTRVVADVKLPRTCSRNRRLAQSDGNHRIRRWDSGRCSQRHRRR